MRKDIVDRLSEIAGEMKMDVTVLSRLVQKYTGSSFTELLHTARFNRAVHMLRETDLSVLDIAVPLVMRIPRFSTGGLHSGTAAHPPSTADGTARTRKIGDCALEGQIIYWVQRRSFECIVFCGNGKSPVWTAGASCVLDVAEGESLGFGEMREYFRNLPGGVHMTNRKFLSDEVLADLMAGYQLDWKSAAGTLNSNWAAPGLRIPAVRACKTAGEMLY